MNDKWISIDEAAEYLGIKTVTLRSWIRNGKEGLPAQKIGKQWKFKCSELDVWVKKWKKRYRAIDTTNKRQGDSGYGSKENGII